MQVLVVHDYGPLGRLLLDRLKRSPVAVRSLLINGSDVISADAMNDWVPEDTDLIVNTLWTIDPELAEADPETAHKLAFTLPTVLAEHASEKGMSLLQLSSCYVFDGRKQGAYIATNPGQPINALGGWQWECEQAIRASLARHVIVRTGWSLGRFIRKVQKGAANGETVALPGRCVGQPVTVTDLARVLWAVIMQLDCGAEGWGTYQYAGAEEISMYELGQAITGVRGISSNVHIVDDMTPWGECEPFNTTMVCTKIRNTFGIKQLPWRNGLNEELDLIEEADKPRQGDDLTPA